MLKRKKKAKAEVAVVVDTEAAGAVVAAVDAEVALYDRLFSAEVPGEATGDPLDDFDPESKEVLTGCKLEPALADTPPGSAVQFERLGYFAHDGSQPMLFHRTVGLRDEWANIQKRQASGS